MLKKLLARQQVTKVGKAESKIMFMLLYFAFAAVTGLAIFTYEVNNTAYQASIFAYIGCETSGLSPINCFEELLDTRSMNITNPIRTISVCALVLWPVPLVILFTCNLKLFRKTVDYMHLRITRSSTSTGTGSSGN